MEHVLIVGCSFAATCDQPPLPPWDGINYSRFTFRGMPGAGNQAISARLRWEVERKNYDHVVVLWSGINRIDIPVSVEFHRRWTNTYPFIFDQGDPVWYFSGGICGSWQQGDACPAQARTQFHEAFVNQTERSASDTTLETVLSTQNWLDQAGIGYDMSFIYDIHRDYNDRVDYENNRRSPPKLLNRWPTWLALEHCLGRVDTASTFYEQVDWEKCRTWDTPYDWCESRDLLQPDRFHPTKEGFRQWMDQVLNIDLLS